MKYRMDQTLRLEVEIEYEHIKDSLPNLTPREVVAGILSEFERKGHASRYVCKDGKIGFRATNKLREDLFEQEQDAMDDQTD